MKFHYDYVTLDRVIDADTARLIIDLGFTILRQSAPYRFARVNAPELSTPEGVAAKAALEAYLVGKRITIDSLHPDAYGRWLVEIFADGINVNDWLVQSGYAVYVKY